MTQADRFPGPEFGIVMEASPGYTARLAKQIEDLGFDMLLCPDTQNLSPDPFAQLALADLLRLARHARTVACCSTHPTTGA